MDYGAGRLPPCTLRGDLPCGLFWRAGSSSKWSDRSSIVFSVVFIILYDFSGASSSSSSSTYIPDASLLRSFGASTSYVSLLLCLLVSVLTEWKSFLDLLLSLLPTFLTSDWFTSPLGPACIFIGLASSCEGIRPWVGFFDKRIYLGLGSGLSSFLVDCLPFVLGKLSFDTVKVSSSIPAMSEFGILLNESEKGFVLTLR